MLEHLPTKLSPKLLIPVALLPLVEPAALHVAFAEGPPSLLGAVATAWLALALVVQIAAFAVSLLATVILLRHLVGRRVAHARMWALLLVAGFFSLVSVGSLDPDAARRSAAARAESVGARVRVAIRDFQLDEGRPPTVLQDLVPRYLGSTPQVGFAGSRIDYDLAPDSVHLYALTIPCPGRSKPFVRQLGVSPSLTDKAMQLLKGRRPLEDR